MSPALRDGLLLGFYCGLIFWLSSQPSLPAPELFPQQDKLVHMTAYAVMGLLAWHCFAHRLPNTAWLAAASITFCWLYGASDEWHQSFVPGRNADVWDWVADSMGAGAAVLYLWLRLKPNRAVRSQ